MMNKQKEEKSYCEFDDIKVEKIPEDVFRLLAYKLTYDWERVARLLLLSESDIDILKSDFSVLYEITFQMLNIWRRRNPYKQWSDLKETLEHVGRNDLVSECERNLISIDSTFGVQIPSTRFYARSDELLKIHKALLDLSKSQKSFLVIAGMTGIGKTQLVRKYIEVYRKHYDSFVWIDAAFGKINISIINLCYKLGINVKETYNLCLPTEVVIYKIHNYFKSNKILYVYDNVDDASIKDFEKCLSNQANSYTIATSQWRCWSPEADIIQIKPFNPQDAFLFLKKYISTKDDNTLKEITEVKRYHPLALYQAITYINNTQVSPQEYLDLFKCNPVDILDEFNHTEDTKSAVLSIRIILQKLKINKEKLSLQILKFLSYCDGENITMRFVKQISYHLKQNDSVKIYHAINVLKNFSLLSNSCDSNLNESYLLMHDITQIACYHFQKNKPKYFNLVVSFMKQKLNTVKDHYNYGLDWYKHFLHIFLKDKAKVAIEFTEYAEEIYCLLQNKGLFKDILAVLEEIESFQTNKYGRNHLFVIDTKHLKAQCIYNMGNFEKAFPVYSELEKLRSKLLGRNHLSTLEVKHNKALCMDGMGDYVGAFKVYRAIEKQYMSLDTIGKKHPKTLETQHNKANCMISLGRFNEALQEYCKLEKLKIEVLGENHLSTLDTKHNIALCMNCLGMYQEAYQMYSKLEEVKIKVLGNSHPSTLKTKYYKTVYFINMSQYEKAFQEFIEIEKLLVIVLGENHLLTLETKHNLAFCQEKMGKYEEALHIYTEVEKLRSEILGSSHPKTLVTQKCIQKITLDNMSTNIVSDIQSNIHNKTEHIKCIKRELPTTFKSNNKQRLLCCLRFKKTYSIDRSKYF